MSFEQTARQRVLEKFEIPEEYRDRYSDKSACEIIRHWMALVGNKSPAILNSVTYPRDTPKTQRGERVAAGAKLPPLVQMDNSLEINKEIERIHGLLLTRGRIRIGGDKPSFDFANIISIGRENGWLSDDGTEIESQKIAEATDAAFYLTLAEGEAAISSFPSIKRDFFHTVPHETTTQDIREKYDKRLKGKGADARAFQIEVVQDGCLACAEMFPHFTGKPIEKIKMAMDAHRLLCGLVDPKDLEAIDFDIGSLKRYFLCALAERKGIEISDRQETAANQIRNDVLPALQVLDYNALRKGLRKLMADKDIDSPAALAGDIAGRFPDIATMTERITTFVQGDNAALSLHELQVIAEHLGATPQITINTGFVPYDSRTMRQEPEVVIPLYVLGMEAIGKSHVDRVQARRPASRVPRK